MKALFAAAAVLTACACASAPPESPQDAFFANLSALCGQSYEGRVVTTDAADANFASERLVMHVRDCSADEVRIPFNVGENRSRTWVITRTEGGLRLKHDHRHEDGSEDVLTQYGGDTASAGAAVRQEFPADEHSRQLFTANNIPASVANVWAVEVHPGRTFAYELRRPNRHFRLEFDLTRPVPTPPPSWGVAPVGAPAH
ncbi:MAG TPA: hypothetical protein VEA80_18135 [Vitreimonas sp.]|uniref:hypothetical protein n=1 Tax=Vitreimonas sp. TaxID=3069702 RepID=UPI002D3AC7DB|nr:hypothetical protein [Vitreimonas sp.]HYD89404.1 hypothetical protein [Vitreimonas sp.]